MSLLVFGHGGARVLAFPTSLGTCSEWPDRRMHEVLGEHIHQLALALVTPLRAHDDETRQVRTEH